MGVVIATTWLSNLPNREPTLFFLPHPQVSSSSLAKLSPWRWLRFVEIAWREKNPSLDQRSRSSASSDVRLLGSTFYAEPGLGSGCSLVRVPTGSQPRDVGTPVQCIQRGALQVEPVTRRVEGRWEFAFLPRSDGGASAVRTWPIIARYSTSIYCGRVARTATTARVLEISISCRLLGSPTYATSRSLRSICPATHVVDYSLPLSGFLSLVTPIPRVFSDISIVK